MVLEEIFSQLSLLIVKFAFHLTPFASKLSYFYTCGCGSVRYMKYGLLSS